MCSCSLQFFLTSYDPVIHRTLRPLVEVSPNFHSLFGNKLTAHTFFFLTPSENAALVAFIQQQTCVNTGSYNPHSRGFQRVRGSKLAKDITGEVGVHLC